MLPDKGTQIGSDLNGGTDLYIERYGKYAKKGKRLSQLRLQ